MGRNITVSVGDMDMGRVMDTATDMAIAVGDFRGLRPPPLFKNFSSVRDVVLCGLVLHRSRPSPLRVSAKNARYSVNLFPGLTPRPTVRLASSIPMARLPSLEAEHTNQVDCANPTTTSLI